MAAIQTRLEELYSELEDLLKYSDDGDPTADAAVVRTLIRELIEELGFREKN